MYVDEEAAAWAHVINLEKRHLVSMMHIGAAYKDSIRVEVGRDFMGELCVRMSAFIWAEPLEKIEKTVTWPKDWWQAFKGRWFPVWAKRRWPVQMHTEHMIIKADALLPMCNRLMDDSLGRTQICFTDTSWVSTDENDK